jgi:dihydroorotase
LPVAKRETHRLTLRAAATSGDARFFLGTDSAPHLDNDKLSACGCAGCFTATNTMPLLAHVFEQENALQNLSKFACENGPNFYGLPQNQGILTLTKSDTPVTFPDKIDTKNGPVTVFDPGFDVYWSAT